MARLIGAGTMLGALAVLGTLAPPSVPVRAADAATGTAEQSVTCAGVYYAYTVSSGDPNYEAMVARYGELNGLDHDAATAAAFETGKRVLAALSDGRLSEADVIDGAGGCSQLFGIALPLQPDTNVLHSLAPAAPQEAFAPASPVEEAPVSPMCRAALDGYVAELRRLPERLAEAGPETTDECDSTGYQCGTSRPNAKFYYALGNACDAIKATVSNAQIACSGEPDQLEGVSPPDRCS